MPDGDEVQFQSPTSGQVKPVPLEHWDEAIKQGYKPTTHSVMYSPEGQRGMVANAERVAKTQAGFTDAPKTQFEKDRPGKGITTEGMGGAVWDAVKAIPDGILKMVDPTSGLSGAGLSALGINPRKGTVSERLNEVPIVGAAKEAKAGWNRATDTRAKLGESVTSGLGGLVGMSGEQAAEAGERGEGGKILGQAAVPAAMTLAAPLLGRAIPKGVNAAEGALEDSRVSRSASKFNRAVAPNSAKAFLQDDINESFARAQKYIAPETREAPLKGNARGAMRSADVADAAKDKLWQQHVQPEINNLAEVQRPASEVAQKIRGTFTDMDRQTRPATLEAGERLAKMFDGPMSVREMADTLRELNNDKGVQQFYKLGADQQAALEAGDPSIRAKIAARNGLAAKLFDTVGEARGAQAGDAFQEARKDWGALDQVSGNLRNARVPTPMPVGQSILEGILGPRELARRYLNNPNRLAVSSFNLLGKTGLEPPPILGNRTPFAPKGILGEGATAAPWSETDTSGSFRGGRWTTPRALLPDTAPPPFQPKGLLGAPPTELPQWWTDPSGPSGSGEPETFVYRDKQGRMQRGYKGTSKQK